MIWDAERQIEPPVGFRKKMLSLNRLLPANTHHTNSVDWKFYFCAVAEVWFQAQIKGFRRKSHTWMFGGHMWNGYAEQMVLLVPIWLFFHFWRTVLRWAPMYAFISESNITILWMKFFRKLPDSWVTLSYFECRWELRSRIIASFSRCSSHIPLIFSKSKNSSSRVLSSLGL